MPPADFLAKLNTNWHTAAFVAATRHRPPIAPQGPGEFLYLTFLIYINIICRFSHLRRSEELAAATLRAYAAAACSPALLSSFFVFPLMFSLSCSLALLLYFLFPLWLYATAACDAVQLARPNAAIILANIRSRNCHHIQRSEELLQRRM